METRIGEKEPTESTSTPPSEGTVAETNSFSEPCHHGGYGHYRCLGCRQHVTIPPCDHSRGWYVVSIGPPDDIMECATCGTLRTDHQRLIMADLEARGVEGLW